MDGRVVQPIQHIKPRAKVIQLLCEREIAGMKNAAGRPARDAHISEHDVKGSHSVRGWDRGADFVETVEVGPEVGSGEEDGDGLLHAQDASKGPFAVELDDGLVGGDAGRGDYALAGVIAFGGAVPEKEAVVEGFSKARCQLLLVVVIQGAGAGVGEERREMLTDRSLRFARTAIFLLAHLNGTSMYQ